MYTLENDQIQLLVDEYGRPFELRNKNNGVNYLRKHDLWRLIVDDGRCLEIETIPSDSIPEITVTGNNMRIRHSEAVNKISGGKYSIELEISFSIENDEIKTGITISNNQPETTVKEVHFPLLAIRDEAISGVVTTYTGGQYFRDVKKKILQSHTQFKGIDHKYIRDVNFYPTNAMNCMLIDHEDEGLYLGCHDEKLEMTAHILELDDQRDFNMLMGRSPYVACGSSWTFDRYVISPYRGSWQIAADKYRSWANCWYQAPERPEFLNGFNGWQRVILKTQYGQNPFPYNKLPEAFEASHQAGVDTLFLFGWHVHGMDNGYPDYSLDEEWGGEEALKKSIADIHNLGGKVILYFNGQLIDRRSEFYREHGQEVATFTVAGEPELHHYSFPGPGYTAAKFGNRAFTTACPSSDRWLDMLKSFIDTAIELEVDAVFFDQIGNAPYPCCNPAHSHPVPYMGSTESRIEQLTELRKYLKSRRPEMGLGVEWISDITANFVDFVHIWGNIAEKENNSRPEDMKAQYISFQEFYRYAFPETPLSNREIRTDEDIERRVNIMLMKGCINDIEIHRCQSTIAVTPHYQQYLAKANRLRSRYADILLDGKFLANYHQRAIDNQEISVSSWSSNDQLALMLTQEHLACVSGTINIPGYSLISSESVRNDVKITATGRSINIELPRNGLAVLLFQSV